jgi:hypothetical protein
MGKRPSLKLQLEKTKPAATPLPTPAGRAAGGEGEKPREGSGGSQRRWRGERGGEKNTGQYYIVHVLDSGEERDKG